MRVVLDTNVVVSAAISRRGASSKLLSLLAEDAFDIALSLPLYLEYKAVLSRDEIKALGVDPRAADELCEDLASIALAQVVHFLWRPWLRDAKDDFVLELAVASGSRYIVTHNTKDFTGQGVGKAFGVAIATPRNMLEILRRNES